MKKYVAPLADTYILFIENAQGESFAFTQVYEWSKGDGKTCKTKAVIPMMLIGEAILTHVRRL